MKKIAIIGGGGHAKVVASIIMKLNDYQIIGYIDKQNNGKILNIPYIGNDDDFINNAHEAGLDSGLDPSGKSDILAIHEKSTRMCGHFHINNKNKIEFAALGIGQIKSSELRKFITGRYINSNFKFPAIISPDAIINNGVKIGMGTVIMDGVVANADAHIGEYSIINTNSTIEHDCNIGNYVHVAPGVTISGSVNIGDGCLIGTGANIVQGIKITSDVVVGAGTNVYKDIVLSGIYVGNPLRKIK